MDRLTSIAAFVRVVENGGFTAAARHLNLSPTMVSNHVQKLEDRLGARLLNRTTRRVSLTEIGREYYERSAHILVDLDEADRAAGALQATPRGRLRVHCHPALARIIAPVVTAYLRDNPEVSVDLRRGDQMIDLLEEGFDLAIRPYVPPDSSLMVRRLTDWRHMLCCSPSYLETHPEPVSPADLSAHNCIRYAFYPFGDEWRFTDSNGGPLAVRVAGNLVTSDTELLRLAVIAGLGVTLIAPFNIHEELRTGSVVPLLRNYPTAEFSISAVYPHRRHLAAKVRVFIDALARLFAGSDWLNPEGAAPPRRDTAN
jgi:DNA-binding transcriptional LysR family regulator